MASTTLATFPTGEHSTSHHPQIPTSLRRSPHTKSRNVTRQCSRIPCQSNGHYGISHQLHQIHLPPHLPEQEHLESGTHKTPGVITTPVNDHRQLQVCPRNIPERDHRIFAVGVHSTQLQGHSGSGFYTYWLFLLSDIGSDTGWPPKDCGQSQSISQE